MGGPRRLNTEADAVDGVLLGVDIEEADVLKVFESSNGTTSDEVDGLGVANADNELEVGVLADNLEGVVIVDKLTRLLSGRELT